MPSPLFVKWLGDKLIGGITKEYCDKKNNYLTQLNNSVIIEYGQEKVTFAELAELADALDSGSSAARLPGSSPGFRI